MILKDFHFREKNLNFVIFVNRKCLKAISSVKTKILFGNNLIHKVWVDLINERQHKTPGFLGKISESRGISLLFNLSPWIVDLLRKYSNS